ncbi:MAG TPA: hypothetical protein VHO25_10280 [Polyangiaceae bacterium]|nr:hypothetical protein [Polyangiaceae bacterium]
MAITDNFAGQEKGVSAFGKGFETITPSDTDALPTFYRAILCGATAGTVACVDDEDNEVTAYVSAGQILQGIRPKQIKETGTTATPLIGIR